MEIIDIDKKTFTEEEKKLTARFTVFEKLVNELQKRELPSEIVVSINRGIQEINSFVGSNKEVMKHVRKKQTEVLKLLEKELKLVTQNHYRNLWLALGMSAFGIPFGVVFGISLGNMAFIGIGIPIGMAIGIAVGTSMDKKAFEEKRQLDLEIK